MRINYVYICFSTMTPNVYPKNAVFAVFSFRGEFRTRYMELGIIEALGFQLRGPAWDHLRAT